VPESDIEEVDKCMSNALRYLEYRARTVAEMRDYLLRKNWAPGAISVVISRLIEMEYLDDVAFAKNYVNSRIRGSSLGPSRIKQDLRRKKVDPEIIESAMESIPTDYEGKEVMVAAEKIWLRHKAADRNARIRKSVAYLVRRGFTYDVASSAIRKMSEDSELGCGETRYETG